MQLAHGYCSSYGLIAPRTQVSAHSIKLNQGREKRQIFTYDLPLDSQLLLWASAVPESYCLFNQKYITCAKIFLL